MIRHLMTMVMRLRETQPERYHQLTGLGRRYLARWLGVYPRARGGEISAVRRVLKSAQWNMTYGAQLEHERLEADFAAYVGMPHAVAVGTGGMGLQMALRALGVRPGNEVLLQADTCSASAFSVMNAGATPVFTDISARTGMMSIPAMATWCSQRTQAVLATHSWGNPEDAGSIAAWCTQERIPLVEDACQSLGARAGNKPAGHWGHAAVFSFGCLKPVQAGEGGIIVTADDSLARELRAMRHYGERSFDFGERDTLMPAWNGRMSEFVAAVARAQLKHYPAHLARLREHASRFAEAVKDLPGFQLMWGAGQGPMDSAITQVVARIDPQVCRLSKMQAWQSLKDQGIPIWHGNFEPIPSLGAFRNDAWRPWLPLADGERISRNYQMSTHPVAQHFFDNTGLGFSRMNFMTLRNTKHLIRSVQTTFGT